MCGTTNRATPPPPVKPLVQVRKDVPLQTYLNHSYQKVRADGKLGPDLGLKTHIPISIYLRSTGTDHIYAGNSAVIDGTLHQLDLEECFSASLMKVAAMFAAYKLRQEAETLRADINSGTINVPVAKFFDKLAERVKPAGAVKKIRDNKKIQTAPSIPDILQITSLSTPVNFTDDFRGHMRRMIIPSNDCAAAECIWRLSYPYINVKLMEDGFFDQASMKGIWLAGDYFFPGCLKRPEGIKKARGQDYVRIPTVNDCDQTQHPPFCDSAQNTTSMQMARFFLKILLEELVDQPSSHEMRLILFEAQHGASEATPDMGFPGRPRDPSFLVKETSNPGDPTSSNRASGSVQRKFDIEAVKIGQGKIKTDSDRGAIEVRSEGMIIKWNHITEDAEPPDKDFDKDLRKKFDKRNLTGEAAICWQNLSNHTPNTDGIIEILNDSIFNFITQAPPP
jgi:hypothetical protein